MSGEIFDIVLPLTEHVILSQRQNLSAVASSAFEMEIHIVHTDEYGLEIVLPGQFALGENYGAVSDIELRPVIADAQAQGEAEGIAEPVDGWADFGIAKHGHDRTRGYGPIRAHIQVSPRQFVKGD